MKTMAWAMLLLSAAAVFAAPVLAEDDAERIEERARESAERARERLADPDIKDFNWLALAGVALGSFVLTAIVWFLQLLIARVLVVIIPILAGIVAGIVIGKNPPDSGEAFLTAVAFAVAATTASLVFMLYASIFTLKSKVAELESRGR